MKNTEFPRIHADALTLHQVRREQGVPTLTALSGPPGASTALWRAWADETERPALIASWGPDLGRRWVESLWRRRDVLGDAVGMLAGLRGSDADELFAAVRAKTPHERGLLLDEVLPRGSELGGHACRVILGGPPDLDAGTVHDSVLASCAKATGEWGGVLAIAELAPPEAWPVLLVTTHTLEGDSIAEAAAGLVDLAERLPSLPIGLALTSDALERLLAGPESRVNAMLREGRVETSSPPTDGLTLQVEVALGKQVDRFQSTIERVLQAGATPAVRQKLAEAISAHQAASLDPRPEAVERARSAAEAFLFEVLEALPETSGRFALNGGAGFAFGTREAEVDLLAREARVAVELDGYYHFQDREAYRRDRRKDLALQEHGYRVVRFLSQDVVERLEAILETIVGQLRAGETRP